MTVLGRYRDWGPVYWNRRLYRLAMGLLRPAGRDAVWRHVAAQIGGASVLDLCCGPAELRRWIGESSYRGIDMNPAFAGADVLLGDVLALDWPHADVLVMCDSLYHFLPDVGPLLRRMTQSARKKVVISEPIENIAASRWPWMRALARWATRVDGKTFPRRFSAEELQKVLQSYGFQEFARIGANLVAVWSRP